MTASSTPLPTGVITVRAARPAEYVAVGELTLDAYGRDGLIGDDADYANHLRNAAERARDSEVMVAVDETGTVVGTVTYCLPGSPYAELSREGQAEFRMLAVAPAERGRGVGARLVRECLDRAARSGCTSVVISTRPTMVAAHRLYARYGFVRTPELDWSPVPGLDLLAFIKIL